MKKALSIILTLATLIGVLGMPALFSHASTSRGLGIADDTVYYIMNSQSKEFLSPRTHTSEICGVMTWGNANSSGIWDYSRIKWLVDKQSDGKYILRSFEGNGYTLRGYDNGYVEVEYEDEYSSVSFEILRENDEYGCDGKYLIKLGDKYLRACDDSNEVELVNATNYATSDMYWTFMAVEKRDASYYYFDHIDMNTISIRNDFIEEFDSCGYDTYSVRNLSNAQYFLDYFLEDDIFIFAGYGSDSSIEVHNSSGTKTGAIIADYEVWDESNEYYLDYDYNALAKARCVLLVASNTGNDVTGADGSTYNLVDSIYSYGAHYVLGFKCDMDEVKIDFWLKTFLGFLTSPEISDGDKNINTAVNYTNAQCRFTVDIYTRGDGNQYINF